MPFMAFHLLGIPDGVGLIIVVRSEALANLSFLSDAPVFAFDFVVEGRASGWLLGRSVLRYGGKADRKH